MICRVMFLLLLCSNVFAQNFNAAPFQGAGNTGIALTSIYSITNNAAGLSRLKHAEVAVVYQSNFVSSEINTQVAYLAIPMRPRGAFGLALHRYGLLNIASLVTASAVYAREFGDHLSTAIGFNYHSFNVLNYGSASTFSVDLGIQLDLLEELRIGAIARNISKEKFDDEVDQYLPNEFGFGAAYYFTEELFVSTDFYYNVFQDLSIRTGASYAIDDMIVLRVGASSKPAQGFAGVGIHFNKIKIDCSSSLYSPLGASPQLALAYVF